MTRLFLDTNIVVDLLDRREPFCHDAVRLFTMAYNKKVQIIVSPMTFTTASFLLRKHGTEGVRILLSNLRQLARVATANERTIDDSLASRFNDFEDAMQYYTAVKAKADIIITRNGKDFTQSKIPVMTASEFLASLR
ncbi:MAG: PIN domain-containing protein [Bacteroidaceae bacterium]|jgi:predicted nucleic acid-binding protein|nr:PIN domain-containing protein [Bacteroidaceae bacterium]MBR4516479.1 PIN domain-containing protein [Bacteroidaceae bacterium]